MRSAYPSTWYIPTTPSEFTLFSFDKFGIRSQLLGPQVSLALTFPEENTERNLPPAAMAARGAVPPGPPQTVLFSFQPLPRSRFQQHPVLGSRVLRHAGSRVSSTHVDISLGP